MARPPGGTENIQAARKLLRSAKTADQLRQAQAVLLPLEMGLSMQQTATVIGRSVGATSMMRTRFAAVRSGARPAPRSKTQLRNRAKATLDEEERILDDVMGGAGPGGALGVQQFKPMIEQKLGQTLSLASVYRMLSRHGWRKMTLDGRPASGAAHGANTGANGAHSANDVHSANGTGGATNLNHGPATTAAGAGWDKTPVQRWVKDPPPTNGKRR